uniref:Uncharacterized protein n=1 Tax=Anopheles christyi TaxID=43041 RepID=A0A182JYY0_9DIPT
MDIVVLVALKIFFILFMVGGYYLARYIKQRRMAPVIVTQEIPGLGYSTPIAIHVPDAQQYNHLGFAQLSANTTIPVPGVANTPVIITSEVHRVTPGNTQIMLPPPGAIIQGHATGTAAYPVMQSAYPAQQPAPYPPQSYMQNYPLQTSAAPAQMSPSHPNVAPMHHPAPPTASAPPGAGAPMMNPPSYDQVVTDSYPVQAPYNPNFKG